MIPAIVFVNGKVAFFGGKPAFDSDCCCPQCNCNGWRVSTHILPEPPSEEDIQSRITDYLNLDTSDTGFSLNAIWDCLQVTYPDGPDEPPLIHGADVIALYTCCWPKSQTLNSCDDRELERRIEIAFAGPEFDVSNSDSCRAQELFDSTNCAGPAPLLVLKRWHLNLGTPDCCQKNRGQA